MIASSPKVWKRFEGIRLAGLYDLQEWLGESDKTAFFRTAYGEDGRPALLKLIPAEGIDTDSQLTLWDRTNRLSHPHLLRLVDFGRSEDTGHSFLYAVFEFPEDRLATALERAPLTSTEAREVREAIGDVLRYIHSQGLVHTAVDAGHIVAVDNQIKLASDTLREASGNRTGAQDLSQLDELLPEPAAQPLPPPARVASVPRRSFPAWASGAMVVILGVLGYVFLPKAEQRPPAPTVSRQPNAPQPAPAPQPVPPPQAAPAAPARVTPEPTAPPTPASTTGPGNWRVIAYTYFSQQAAQRRADSINQKWPGAKAEVFMPTSGRPAYLVALGGWFTRDEAVQFLKISRGKGLPRDIYIQNYTR